MEIDPAEVERISRLARLTLQNTPDTGDEYSEGPLLLPAEES